jgi:RNA polymerase sigma-70 factor (ECF subfamily)
MSDDTSSERVQVRTSVSDPSAVFLEERHWVRQIRAGDEQALRALYDRYGDLMFAFAYSSLKSRAEAQDVVQDVFLNIVRNRATWDVTGEVRTYLLRAVYNRVATLRRHLRVELTAHETIVRDAGAPDAWTYRGRTDDALTERELAEALERAIEAIPPRAQQAYRLVREQHLTRAEAAEVMGVTLHTVELHLTRALKALRDKLAGWR